MTKINNLNNVEHKKSENECLKVPSRVTRWWYWKADGSKLWLQIKREIELWRFVGGSNFAVVVQSSAIESFWCKRSPMMEQSVQTMLKKCSRAVVDVWEQRYLKKIVCVRAPFEAETTLGDRGAGASWAREGVDGEFRYLLRGRCRKS